MMKCLEYAEADVRGKFPGRAEVMISQIQDQVEREGYAWEGPSRESTDRVHIDDDGIVHVDGEPFFQLQGDLAHHREVGNAEEAEHRSYIRPRLVPAARSPFRLRAAGTIWADPEFTLRSSVFTAAPPE